eukprot:TRINITY_DN306_c3_g1_i1.p2 TRINITY_DN306_c3_g1~~TRINITY_DN306_c3_g1_i1.p2  ORF type:complete len:57 (+),score=0.84 TRINITY_DN306_c3_g1_i1:53-223(+)
MMISVKSDISPEMYIPYSSFSVALEYSKLITITNKAQFGVFLNEIPKIMYFVGKIM